MEVTMKPALWLLLVALSVPNDSMAENQRFVALYHQWQRLHESAATDEVRANSYLIVEPREEAVWIETDGKIESDAVQPLPRGLEWSAYLITSQGVTQISFPVRLSHPRSIVENDDEAEEIWI